MTMTSCSPEDSVAYPLVVIGVNLRGILNQIKNCVYTVWSYSHGRPWKCEFEHSSSGEDCGKPIRRRRLHSIYCFFFVLWVFNLLTYLDLSESRLSRDLRIYIKLFPSKHRTPPRVEDDE